MRRNTHCAIPCLVVLSIASVSPAASFYEMSISPDGDVIPMTKVGTGYGIAPGGLQGDGTYRFVDAPALSGNHGFWAGSLSATFTIDMRVKSNRDTVTGNGARRSMGIHNGSVGRGIRIETAALTLVDGGGATIGTATASLADFHRIRLVVNAGNAYVYDLDNDLDADPNTYDFALLAGPVTLGDSGFGAEIVGQGGAVHLNSLSNSGTDNSDFSLDYLRIDPGVNRGATGAPLIQSLLALSPEGVQSSTAFYNQVPAPEWFDYTLSSVSTSSINYTVTEVTSAGAATDYSWINLTQASGAIPGGGQATFRATLNSTSLPPAIYHGFLKVADDSPLPPAVLTEPFTYADGKLPGNGPWTGTAGIGQVEVLGSEVRLTGSSTASDASATVNGYPFEKGVVTFRVKIRAGSTDAGSNIGNLYIKDPGGLNLAWLRLRRNAVLASDPINAGVATVITLGTAYTELEVRIDTMAKRASYKFGGVDVVAYNYAAAATGMVRTIQLAGLNNGAGESVWFDDMSLAVTEQYKVRPIDMEVLGCAIEVQEPRAIVANGCNPTAITTETFTIKNNGAYAWTGFRAVEYNDDDDWLTLEYSSGPVPQGGTATVLAHIDWSLTPITYPTDDQIGTIRFQATCDGGTTWVSDTPPNTLTVSDPPQVVKYDGSVLPSAADSGGPGITFTLYEGSEQGTAGVLDVNAVDSLAYHLSDTDSAKTKWRSNPAIDIVPSTGATLVARLRTAAPMGTLGENLMIHHAVIGSLVHWGGPSSILRDMGRNTDGLNVVGDGDYHVIRVTTQDEGGANGIVVNIYLDENSTPVLHLVNTAAYDTGQSFEAFGFGAGSTSGAQDLYFDFVNATSAGAFAPHEEDSCVGYLGVVNDCHIPRADADGDGDVDMEDFAELQRCLTVGTPLSVIPAQCKCLDLHKDAKTIDSMDVSDFARCATGAGIPWVATENCPN
jgi:hypothetical protein